jgi:hypothetical protein
MGNSAGSLKKHIETAEKTGALNFTDKGLEKFPPDLAKVDLFPLASKFLYYIVEYRKIPKFDHQTLTPADFLS